MANLAQDDFVRVLKAVEILGRDAAYDTFPLRLVEAIRAAADIDFVAYSEVDPASGQSRFLLSPDLAAMDPASRDYAAFVRRFGNHPLIAQGAAAGPRAAGSFIDRLRLMGVVGNCCGEAEISLNLGFDVASAGRRLVGVAINRAWRDFDAADAARIELLRPHVVLAFRNLRLPPAAQTPDAIRADPPLTPRELEVLHWVSMGKSNEEVAAIVGARSSTVKKHLEHIYDKLGVPNRTAAAQAGRAAAPTRSLA
ncbi:MAG: helix-turn-helix transcriptional regulator [Cucumibacter sp.]